MLIRLFTPLHESFEGGAGFGAAQLRGKMHHFRIDAGEYLLGRTTHQVAGDFERPCGFRGKRGGEF